jgi:hypothetical protein
MRASEHNNIVGAEAQKAKNKKEKGKRQVFVSSARGKKSGGGNGGAYLSPDMFMAQQ